MPSRLKGLPLFRAIVHAKPDIPTDHFPGVQSHSNVEAMIEVGLQVRFIEGGDLIEDGKSGAHRGLRRFGDAPSNPKTA